MIRIQSGRYREGVLLSHRQEKPVGQLLSICSGRRRPFAKYAESSVVGSKRY